MIKPDYPSVLLIYTGGTIGMIENPETGALEAFNFDQLQENEWLGYNRLFESNIRKTSM